MVWFLYGEQIPRGSWGATCQLIRGALRKPAPPHPNFFEQLRVKGMVCLLRPAPIRHRLFICCGIIKHWKACIHLFYKSMFYYHHNTIYFKNENISRARVWTHWDDEWHRTRLLFQWHIRGGGATEFESCMAANGIAPFKFHVSS